MKNLLKSIYLLPALAVLPALADDPITNVPVFVFGDVALSGQHVAYGQAAFAGRRMDNWVGGKYQNDFPNYKLVGRSFSVDSSDIYVGPVNLVVRELTDGDHFTFNYQVNEVDVDLGALSGVDWNDSEMTVGAKVGAIIGGDNAQYTAPAVWLMSRKNDSADMAGKLSFDNTFAVVDGATITADDISITNSSTVQFVKQDTELLNTSASFFTNAEDIASNGVTTLNAENIDVINSNFVVSSGAKVVLNASDMARLNAVGIQNNNGSFVNAGKMILFGSFSGNETTANGGVIYNQGDLTIHNSKFTNNKSTGNSGAIAQHNTSSRLTLNNVDFSGNSSDWGGAMVARGIVDITGGSFVGNKSNDGGGAIYLATLVNKGHKLSIDGTTFTNNYTLGVDVDGGGAIGSFSDLVLKNSKFTGNHVDGTTSDGGGAIFMGSVSTNDLENVTFVKNKSVTNGGAISTRSVNLGNNVDATLNIAGSTFTSNVASGNGGAIYNTLHNDKANNGYVTLYNTTYAKNSAMNGGAIYNETSGSIDTTGGVMKLLNASFTNNIAHSKGGAIYNAGTMILSGTNGFEGNMAKGVANDIHNTGDLTFDTASTTFIYGGITGNGDMTVSSGARLNLETSSVTQDSLVLNGIINATLLNTHEYATFNIADEFIGNGTLNLTLKNIGDYNVFTSSVLDNDHVNVLTSDFLTYNWNNTFDTIYVTTKPVEEIIENTGVAAETVAPVVMMANTESSDLKELASKMLDKLSGSDADRKEVAAAVKSVHPETEAVVQSVATSVQTTVGNLAATRMSMPAMGRAGGDIEPTGSGFWANGLYNRSEQKDSFTGYTRGFAIGMDGTFNKVFTIGTGYSYSHSDVDAKGRDTDVKSYTMFVYGQYKPGRWYANTVLNYTMSDYSEKGSALGVGIVADYDVHAYGIRLATGYDMANGVTPEFGLRYTHIDADDYENSLGIKNSLKDTDYMTLTLGGKYARGFKTKYKHISWLPEVHGLLKYDVISDDSTAVVTMPGVDSYSISGDGLAKFGVELGLGITMKYFNADWTLDYDLEVRQDYTSHTGRIKWRYNF